MKEPFFYNDDADKTWYDLSDSRRAWWTAWNAVLWFLLIISSVGGICALVYFLRC